MNTLRKLFVAAVMVTSAHVGYCGDINGFRGMLWGDPPAKLGGAHLLENDGVLTVYDRSSDRLEVGDAQVKHIVYYFYRDQLESVIIKYKGINNFYALQRSLNATYGTAEPSNQAPQAYVWRSNAVGVGMLKYDSMSTEGMVLISSRRAHLP
jgi:hypothetical protein